MPQPPTIPVLAHENVRAIPSLSQKTFFVAAAAANQPFIWEFDLAARITDPNQFLNSSVAPANSNTIAGGGAGLGGGQTTPQPAMGPFADVFILTTGAGGGSVGIDYAVDASPCSYYNLFTGGFPAFVPTEVTGLRVTARFVRFTVNNATAAATIEIGFYIRNV